MNRRGLWILLAFVVCVVGCATGPAPRPQSPSAPRARCLVDPVRDANDPSRPLFFLFCVESP